jgi:uncharacterized integral membrane protein (TIGR00697 family)
MTRGQRLFVILNGLFIAFLLMAEVTGGKLFQVSVAGWPIISALKIDTFTMTLGVIPFPITFIVTDLLNEYYGRKGVRFTTLLGMAAIACAYLLILIDINITAASFSPVTDDAFRNVFANSGAIIFASMIAYLIGQFIDIQVFHLLRKKTANKHIWLRATGSTIISQLIDSFVVIYIAFGSGLGTRTLPLNEVSSIALTNFVYKVIVAILITPLIYLGHRMINRYLGTEAEALLEKAHKDESFNVTPYPA